MIKNIIFDFGNVLLEWNEDKIASNYANNKEEKEILKKVILKSNNWFKLDDGTLDYKQAIKLFKEDLPTNLSIKVEEIMNTWYKNMPINQEISELIKKLKENNYKVYALSNTHIPVYEYIKNSEVGKYFDGIEQIYKDDILIYELHCSGGII